MSRRKVGTGISTKRIRMDWREQLSKVGEWAIKNYTPEAGWRWVTVRVLEKFGKEFPVLKAVGIAQLTSRLRCMATEKGMAPLGLSVPGAEKSVSAASVSRMPEGIAKKAGLPERKMLDLLRRRGSLTVSELSRTLDRSKASIIKMLDTARDAGFMVVLDKTRGRVTLIREPGAAVDRERVRMRYFGDDIRIGLVSDTHFGSRYQQLTRLQEAYATFDEEKVHLVLHSGDIVDGVQLYRGHTQELFLQGADEQRDYAVDNYPVLPGIKTHIVAGNHDLSFKKTVGYNIVQAICAGRDDLVYEGEVSGEFLFQNCVLRLLHPSGGVAYARSYKPQKIAEALAATAIDDLRASDPTALPHLLALGHWHITNLGKYMGVVCISLPCFQSQTPYLAAKGLQPELGWVVLHMRVADQTVSRIRVENFWARPIKNDYTPG